MRTAAAAPSEVCEELPAVTVPCAWKAGLSWARASAEVSARGPSSAENTSFMDGLAGLCSGRGGGDGDRNEFFVEAAGGLRGDGFLVAREGEGVLIVAGDAVAAGDALGGEAHGEQRGGVVGGEPWIGAGLVAAHGDEAHGFDAAGDDDLRAAGADALIGKRNGLKARGAEAVDGDAGNFDRQARRAERPCGRCSSPARLPAARSRG